MSRQLGAAAPGPTSSLTSGNATGRSTADPVRGVGLGTRPSGRPALSCRGTGQYRGSRPMEPVIHLRDAVVVLGRFPALAGASLRVERGEIVLLQGPNGAGKTTLLRVCAGLVPVVRGERLGAGGRPHARPARGALQGGAAGARQRPLRRPQRGRERALLGTDGRGGPGRGRSGHGSAGAVRSSGRHRRRPPLGRAAAPGGAWPRWWPVVRSCGCWTSPTPVSTPRAATWWTSCCARRRLRAPPSWWPPTSRTVPRLWPGDGCWWTAAGCSNGQGSLSDAAPAAVMPC